MRYQASFTIETLDLAKLFKSFQDHHLDPMLWISHEDNKSTVLFCGLLNNIVNWIVAEYDGHPEIAEEILNKYCDAGIILPI